MRSARAIIFMICISMESTDKALPLFPIYRNSGIFMYETSGGEISLA